MVSFVKASHGEMSRRLQGAMGKTRLNHGRAMWQGHGGVPDNTAALVLRAIPPLDSETEQSRRDGRR